MSIFAVKGNVVVLEASICHAPEVPEAAEPGEEGTRYRAEWRGEGLEDEESDTGPNESKANVDNVVEMHLGWRSDIHYLEQNMCSRANYCFIFSRRRRLPTETGWSSIIQ